MRLPSRSRAKSERCAGSAWGQRARRNATMRLHQCPASSPRKTRENAIDEARAGDVSMGVLSQRTKSRSFSSFENPPSRLHAVWRPASLISSAFIWDVAQPDPRLVRDTGRRFRPEGRGEEIVFPPL